MIPGFQSQKNICVDTHVHRTSSIRRKTREPNETEQALYEATDERWWHQSQYLVTWGQNVCQPLLAAVRVRWQVERPCHRCC